MWAERTARARREISGLASSGIGVPELLDAVLEAISATVPSDQACWAGVDPESMVMTSIVNRPLWPVSAEYAARFAASEYSGTEPNSFAELVSHGRAAARLSDAPHREVVASVRLNDLLRPQGLEHELRAAFCVDGRCWAVGSMFRSGTSDYSDRELEFIASIVSATAAAARVAARVSRPAGGWSSGPVILLVGAAGDVRAATPAAALWLAELEDAAPGRFGLTALGIAASARRDPSGTARARMRDGAGNWVALQASRLITEEPPPQMVVTVEPASIPQVMDLMLTAHGATGRERDVCAELLTGRSTSEIAEQLHLSPHTVHDHTKALYEKFGVGSRGELVARLLP